MIKTAEQTLGYQQKPNSREWSDDECKAVIEDRNQGYKICIGCPTKQRDEYEQLRRRVGKICRRK
jgi:hypothetical protein